MDGPRTAALAVALALLLGLSPVAALPLDAGGSAAVRPPEAGPSPSTELHPPAERDTPDPAVAVGPVPPGTDGTPPVTGGRNTTAYLAIAPEEVERTRFGTARIDAAGAAAIDGTAVEGRYSYLSLQESFTATGTAAERGGAAETALERLDGRVDALNRRERAALAAFNDGEMTTGTYLRELAVVDERADELSRSLTRLYEFVDSMQDPPVSPSRIAEQKARLVGLRGPVRDRVAAAMRGEADPVRVVVESSDTAVVLATVTGSELDRQYVREAYLPAVRDPGGTDQFRTDRGYDLEAARSRASELYPWTFANAGPTSTGLRTGEPYLYRGGVYSVTVDHPHGTSRQGDLVTYLDGATGEVFREVQFKEVSEVPTDDPRTNRSDGLYVAVNRTHPGGPLSVRVRSNATGDPVDASVSIDGQPVGSTGSDGRLWTVAPNRGFTVGVRSGGSNVTVGPMLPYAAG